LSPVDPSPGWVGRVILLDIEGTTTPVEFVTKVLLSGGIAMMETCWPISKA